MRKVLISGGTSGIGFVTAKKFLSKGDKVFIAAIDSEENINSAMSELKTVGEAYFCHCDISDQSQCEDAVEKAVELLGRIDILVNVAGIVGKRADFCQSNLEDIKKVIDVNLMGTINLSYFTAKKMTTKKSGVIVNVGSICGFMANTENIAYHASKGGVKMLTQAMARELSPHNIRVLSVAPAWVKTSMMETNIENFGNTLHMSGKVIMPEQIANSIYLLTLDEANAINGSTVMLDDGYSSFKGIDGISQD